MTEVRFCADCGGRVVDSDLFCSSCGAAQHAAKDSPAAPLLTTAPAGATRTPWTGLDLTFSALALALGAALLVFPWYKILSLTAVEQPKGWTAIIGVVAAAAVILSVLTGRTTQGGRVVGWLGSFAALASVVLKYALPQLEYGNEIQVNSMTLEAYGTGFWISLSAAALLVLFGTVRLCKRPPSW
jgi:hypothetical protein